MVALDHAVCGVCGVACVRGAEKWLHIDALPEKTEEHEVADVKTRREYLFGKEQAKTGGDLLVQATERQAVALERIAAALENLVLWVTSRPS